MIKFLHLFKHYYLGISFIGIAAFAKIHIYEKCGYIEIERPKEVGHSTMNRFFLKEL